MKAHRSTQKTGSTARKNAAPLRHCIASAAILSFLLMPSFPAGAELPQCIPQKDLFGNYQAAEKETPLPDIPFLTETGEETTLGAYNGKGLVINFWATWCAPCVREMPQLDRLSAFVRENGIDVLTISEDRTGLKAASKFYATHKLNDLPILADPKGKLMRAVGAPGLPLTMLIDAKGREIGRIVGPAEWDSVEIVEFVRDCLAPIPPS